MNWYCLHAKPRREENLVAYCRDQLELETFYPRLRQHRRIRRVWRTVTGPLFPRYAFCRFDPKISYRAVRYAKDAIGIVHFGGRPAVVADAVIEHLKSWAGETGDVIVAQPALQNGDPVEIIDGPMRGLSAVILRSSSDRERVEILLSLLQCEAQVVISRTQVRRVV
jgi:transcription antitermination factor NusG